MANVSYWSGSWTSGVGDPPLAAGKSQNWVAWGFTYGDVINVTAHPVNRGEEVILSVESIMVEYDSTGNRIYFTVRNTGSNYTRGYTIGISFISA